MRASSANEFPLLAAAGLYAASIRGDGNCLFNALSDQLYGHQNEHHKIRARVIEYMRENGAYYKQFVDVHAGGGFRRNPKRKNAGSLSTPVSSTVNPTADEIDRVFEAHLARMAKGGTYGDNMEITAFSAAFHVDVKIYQRDFAYMVSGAGGSGERKGVVHIAYHMWEHFSSVRNINGPHTGLPYVQCKVSPAGTEQANVTDKKKVGPGGAGSGGSNGPMIASWMIEVVMQSVPHLGDRAVIKKTLEEHKGNIDEAVSKLLDAYEGRSSVSSAPDSSSVERDADSEDDDDDDYDSNNNNSKRPMRRPYKKKQDRRLSRAARSAAAAAAATTMLTVEPDYHDHGSEADELPRIDITLDDGGGSKTMIISRAGGALGSDGDGDCDADESDWRPTPPVKADTPMSDYSDISNQVPSVTSFVDMATRGGEVKLHHHHRNNHRGAVAKKSKKSTTTTTTTTLRKKRTVVTNRKKKPLPKKRGASSNTAAVGSGGGGSASATGTDTGGDGDTADDDNDNDGLALISNGGGPAAVGAGGGTTRKNTPVIEVGIKTLYI